MYDVSKVSKRDAIISYTLHKEADNKKKSYEECHLIIYKDSLNMKSNDFFDKESMWKHEKSTGKMASLSDFLKTFYYLPVSE